MKLFLGGSSSDTDRQVRYLQARKERMRLPI
jgi:hypothetical protein